MRVLAHLAVVELLVHAVDVAVQRSPVVVQRRLSPSSRVESPCSTMNDELSAGSASPGAERDEPFGYGCVEASDAEVRVAWRRAVPLHADEPGRRSERRDRQRLLELLREVSGLLLLELRLELLALVVPAQGVRVVRLGDSGRIEEDAYSSPNSVILGLVWNLKKASCSFW